MDMKRFEKITCAALAVLLTGGICMAFRTQAANLQKRRTLVVRPEAGIDVSHPATEVAAGRASDMVNMVGEAGTLRKRCGWRQVLKVAQDGGRIHGIWSLSGGRIIIHAGTHLYLAWEPVPGSWRCNQIEGIEMADGGSMGFTNGDRLYLFGGGRALVVEKVETQGLVTTSMKRLEDKAYAPTTTVSINDRKAERDTRVALESVNLLTEARINTMMGRAWDGSELMLEFLLDGEADTERAVEVTVTTEKVVDNERQEVVYVMRSNPESEGFARGNLYLVENGVLTDRYVGSVSGRYLLLLYNTVYDSLKQETVLDADSLTYEPVQEGIDNISAKFYVKKPEGAFDASLIGEATCGIIFSTDGAEDRLILGGFPDAPERVYISGEGDYSYFPDDGYITVGTRTTAVCGFSRVSDGVLAIHKAAGGGQSTMYYASGQEKESYDDDGLIKARRLTLKVVPGGEGEAMLTPRACADLYGDPLILTRTGVYAVRMVENVAVAERKLTERSGNIRARIMRENEEELTRACAAVWEGHYYLAVGTHCYVADASDQFTDSAGRRQYEWYYFDNIPATAFCVLDGRLLFGTQDGRLCRMGTVYDNDVTYADVTEDAFSGGEVSTVLSGDEPDYVRVEDGYVTVPRGYPGGRIIFEGGVGSDGHIGGLCHELGHVCVQEDGVTMRLGTVRDGGFVEDADRIGAVFEGMTVTVDGSGTEVDGLACTVAEADRGSGCIRLEAGGKTLTQGVGSVLRLLRPLGGEALDAGLPDEHAGDAGLGWARLTFADGSGAPWLTYVGGVGSVLTGRIIREDAVSCAWYSRVFDLGTNMNEKTVLGLTVSTEPTENGEVSVGYETRATGEIFGSRGIGGMSLDSLDFCDFTLTPFASSYTKHLHVRHVNFIRLRFRSEGAYPCCVHDMTVLYTIGRMNRGGI